MTADRDLPVGDVVRAFTRLGCDAHVEGSWLRVERVEGGKRQIYTQHLHKGGRDILHRGAVRRAYRRFGFTADEFYARS